jgi:predicted DNA-binding transcriptional regulator YafY
VAPHGLVLKAGRWYLVARHGGQLRTYRVSRLLDAELLAEPFERLPGFVLAEYWAGYLARFDERRHRAEAVLRVSAGCFELLDQLLEPAMVAAARRTAGEPDADGWRQVTVPVESAAQAVPELLRLGPDAEVVAPADLRDRMIDALETMAARYRRTAS